MQEANQIRTANEHAMHNGITLGLFGLLTLYVFKESFSFPFFSTLFGVMVLGGPVLATVLTLRFRGRVVQRGEAFGFLPGFLHTLFCGFYASIWVALGIFVYLQYIDHGRVFEAWQHSLADPNLQLYLQQPEISQSINEMTNGKGVSALGEAMRSIGAANYAALSLYATLVFDPIISLIVGLIARRGSVTPPPFRG